jgi:hypothetical protein
VLASDNFFAGICWDRASKRKLQQFSSHRASASRFRLFFHRLRQPFVCGINLKILSDRTVDFYNLIEMALTLTHAKKQQSKLGTPSRHHRRCRKVCHGAFSLSKSPGLLQTYIFLIMSAISLFGGHAFVLQPGRQLIGPISTRTGIRGNYHRTPTPLFLSSNAGGPRSDEEEWKAMLAAFQMYKAAYGNLKVPLRFTVPALAPWPG